MKIPIILISCVLLTGCWSTSNPPLIDSEIPFQVQKGTYIDIQGNSHIVTVDTPRWCVSEAYIYDSVSNKSKDVKPKWYSDPIIWILLTLLFVTLFKR